jgi:hypothetical protein
MQPPEPRQRKDFRTAVKLGFWRSALWAVFAEAQMSSVIVVIAKVFLLQTSQVLLTQHDDVIEDVAAQGSDHSFRDSILPGRPE